MKAVGVSLSFGFSCARPHNRPQGMPDGAVPFCVWVDQKLAVRGILLGGRYGESIVKSMHLIIIAVGVLLAGCAEPDKRGLADAQGNSFADGQAATPSIQFKLPVRRGQGVPTGRYGRPAIRTAL